MTTLYFEASDEDDLRKTGISKDSKQQNKQYFAQAEHKKLTGFFWLIE